MRTKYADALKINHICGVPPKLTSLNCAAKEGTAFLQSYWGNPNLTQLIPSCPDVPFSRHSRFHSTPFFPSSPAISWSISIPHPSSHSFLLSFPHCTWHHLFPRDYWVTYCRAKHRNSTLGDTMSYWEDMWCVPYYIMSICVLLWFRIKYLYQI